MANTVQTLARTVGLDKAASEKGLTVITTDLIAQTDPLPGIGNAKDLDVRCLPPRRTILRAWRRRPRDMRSIR